MPDAETVKQFFDLGGLVVLAAIAIAAVYKLAIYFVERERQHGEVQLAVISKLTDTIDRNTQSNTKLYEAILQWDRYWRRSNEEQEKSNVRT